VTLTGTGLFSGSQPYLTGNGRTIHPTNVVFVSSTQLQLTMQPNQYSGLYTWELNNAGCITTSSVAMTYLPLSLIVFIDPPVIYSGITNQITLYTSGLGVATAVNPLDSQGQIVQSLVFSMDPLNANRIFATVVQGTPAGTYSVSAQSGSGCQAQIANGLTTVSTTTISVSAVDPKYVWNSTNTAVTITGSGFNPAPYVYIYKQGSTFSLALLAVFRVSTSTITATVPSGLTLGTYDLIVVNQNGQVGVLIGGVVVVSIPPPVVTSVSPSALTTGGGTVQIVGTGFINATVDMFCAAAPDSDFSTNYFILEYPDQCQCLANRLDLFACW
jgi:hypothetical protein